MDGTINFYRNWKNYKLGFGEVNAEHWLGNHKLSLITSLHADNELRIDLEAIDNTKVFAQYSSFQVMPEKNLFMLNVSGYTSSSTAGTQNILF